MNNGDIRDFEWLLGYEMKQSARHRRFVSLVMISANGSSHRVGKILNDVVRETDPVFSLPGSMAVLMGETDGAGANQAVERYRKVIGEAKDIKYAVASFPNDGKNSGDLIKAAHSRLDTNRSNDG